MIHIRAMFAAVFLAGLLCLVSTPTHAAGEIATTLSIDPLESVTVGSAAIVSVTLAAEDGTVIVDEPITLTIDGNSRPRRWTDAEGVAVFNVPRDLLPGEHEVVASYAGRKSAYLPTTARAGVVIVPYELAVETVPSLPGMVFEIDGTRFEADADGVARVGLDRLGEHTLRVVAAAYRHPRQRVEFSRWGTETFGPTITIRTPSEVKLQAGFDVSFEVSLKFVDPHGDRVDEARIDEVTLRNSAGADFKIPDGRPQWYKAIRTIRRPAGLETVPIRYSLEGVTVDGANVVNVGQQRFDVEPGDVWSVDVLLYSVRMVPNDALFGFPVGGSVVLTYPSGSTTRTGVVDGEVAATGLARGLYEVKLEGAPGWSPVTPIALSRDQEVRIRVVTYVDVTVVLVLGLSVALGLLHIGRPHLAPAAILGAKGFVGAVRNPRSISAFIVRRRAATSVPEMAPAVAQTREFVLHVRTAYSASVIPSEPFSHPQPTPPPARDTVPIAQVIRATLGTPPPADRPVESAALSTPAPTSRPGVSVLVPAIAVAKPLSLAADARQPTERRAAAVTGETPAASEPTGEAPRKPRRTGPPDLGTAPKQTKPRGIRPTANATTDPAAAAELGTAKPSRAKALAARSPMKRSARMATAPTPSPEPGEAKSRARSRASAVSNAKPAGVKSAGAKTTKPRLKATTVESDKPRFPKTAAAAKKRPATIDAGGINHSKAPSATNPAASPEVTIGGTLEPGISDVAIHPAALSATASDPTAPDLGVTATREAVVSALVTDVVSVARGTMIEDPARREPRGALTLATDAGAADAPPGSDLTAVTPEPKPFDRTQPPPPSREPGRLARPRGRAESLCPGCGAPLGPGAKYCRRCGRATVVGTLQRERSS